MTKARILVSGLMAANGVAKLKQYFDVDYDPATTDRQWVLAHLKDYDGLVVVDQKADRELIAAGAKLKIITTHGVGFDHVDIAYAKKKGIIVTNCPQSVRQSTAEMTMALLLTLVRRVDYYDHQLRAGKWVNVSEPQYMGNNLAGKVLGIFGLGRIGQTVAKMAQAFGMRVIYYQRHRLSLACEGELGVTYAPFSNLVKTADVISLHAPATPETTGTFNAAVFDQMRDTAVIINTARGALVDQDALYQALQNKQLAGAGLDVFVDEPKVPTALTKLDNVVLTPHVGTGTHEARAAIADEAADNLIAYFKDHRVRNQVNP